MNLPEVQAKLYNISEVFLFLPSCSQIYLQYLNLHFVASAKRHILVYTLHGNKALHLVRPIMTGYFSLVKKIKKVILETTTMRMLPIIRFQEQ